MQDLNTYVVKMLIRSGEYQKLVKKLILAKNEEEAKRESILRECHGEPEWTDTGAADQGWQFHYSVCGCVEVDPEDAAVLQKYF